MIPGLRPARRLPRARAALGVALEVGLELLQRPVIDLALELDHGLDRHPVVAPAPGIELGLVTSAQLHVAVAPDQAQQVPDLLLATVVAAPFTPQPLFWNVVAQPLAGASEELHVARLQADLFLELPEHRGLGRFALLDAALRKLPGVLLDSLAPENLVLTVT